ncbi:DNA polymerase [Aliarcobacter butzleri]|nr:DNA polymerase [Aliarcobacter butzleri]
MIEKFEKLLLEYENLDYLPIGFAEISFKFPVTCKYPNLSVYVKDFGLINPLEGRTIATLPEIHLALYQNADITFHEAGIIDNYVFLEEYDIKEEEKYVFRSHLRNLIELRKKAKDEGEDLLQELYKTYSNSLYGKLSQGISERNSFNVREGTTTRLPKSDITNSYYASIITGLIRAALSEVLVAINELIEEGRNYKIISATTDGLLYGIDEKQILVEDVIDCEHQSYNYESIYEALKNGYNRFKAFEMVDPILYERLEKFPSLRLLKLSQNSWDSKEFIEIKHVANEILNIKTRGQVGFYEEK